MNAGLLEGDIRGNNIRLVSVTIRGYANLPAVTPDVSNYIRMIVYWDSGWANPTNTNANLNIPGQYNGLLGAYTGSGSTAAATIGPTVFSGYNVSTIGGSGKRYKVLWERTMTLSATGKQMVTFHKKIKLNKQLGFTQATLGYVNQCIGVFMISDSNILPNPYIGYSARICYTT